MAQACNPSAREAEAGGSSRVRVQASLGKPWLHGETLFQVKAGRDFTGVARALWPLGFLLLELCWHLWVGVSPVLT